MAELEQNISRGGEPLNKIIIPNRFIARSEVKQLGEDYIQFYNNFAKTPQGRFQVVDKFDVAEGIESLQGVLVPDLQRAGIYLAGLSALIGSGIRLTRKDFLRAPAALALLPSELAVERQAPQIVPVDYRPTRGQHRSFYWLPLDGSLEGEAATGFNEGGPWDEYDGLDRALNGNLARSVYWPKMGGFASTRDFLIYVAYQVLHSEGRANYLKIRPWAGYCMEAAAGSFFAPPIEGPKTIIVGNQRFEFSERDRLVIAAMRWAGLAREPIDPKNIASRFNKGEAIVVNHSDDPDEEWWGIVKEMLPDGTIVVNRTIKWWERGLQKLYKHHTQLRGANILNENRAEPGYEGNFAVVDRLVGGLIIGTHELLRAA